MATQDRRRHHSSRVPRLLAAVAVVVLLGTALPARAQTQYYDFSGSVYTGPVDFFPIDRFTSFYDFGLNTMYVGWGTPGSFTAFAGAWMKLGAMNLGSGGSGDGTVDVIGGRLDLGGDGSAHRLVIGNWGTGAMTVSAGGLVDATVDASACSGSPLCMTVVGAAAGSTGSLTVTGSGSEVRTLRQFIVASAYVDAGYGTPGGTANAAVSVLDGGTLRTEAASIGTGPSGPGMLGSERTFATVAVDGLGSQWIVTRNSIDNTSAYLVAATHANAQATINVTGGGKLIVDGTGSIGPTDVINLGMNGGQADLTVSGVGSEVRFDNTANGLIQVGRSGATGRGSFNVLSGASASALYLNVGRDGAQGTVQIDGAGSVVTLSGAGTPGVGGPAFANIGRNEGSGSVTVSNGGRLFITDAGGDSRASGSSPGIVVGRDAGSNGSFSIAGAGSSVEIVSTSLGEGTPDNYNPYVSVGFNAGSTGQLSVTDGGKLTLTGNALSSAADPRGTGLVIGGRNDATAGGNGDALISGAGSEVRVQGADAYVSVGRGPGSVGLLRILDGAHLEATGMDVGRVGGIGTLEMDNATARLSGPPFSSGSGPGVSIGMGTGSIGTATLRNGSTISLHGDLSTFGLNVGGHPLFEGGTGVLALESGSKIEASGSQNHAVSIGRSLGSVGVMTMDGASSVALSSTQGYVYIGRVAGATGALTMNGGSSVSASYVGVGSTQGADAGVGTLIVNDSVVTATTIEIGSNGLIGGDEGTINGNLIVRGTVAPGESPGRMIINVGVFMEGEGKIVLDIESDGHGGFDTDELVFMLGSSFEFGNSKVIFNFVGDTNPNEFGGSGEFDMDTFMRSRNGSVDSGLSSVFAPGTDWGDYYTSGQFSAQSDVYDIVELTFNADGSFGVVAVVPEPAEWTLMLGGLALLAMRTRARSQRAQRRA